MTGALVGACVMRSTGACAKLKLQIILLQKRLHTKDEYQKSKNKKKNTNTNTKTNNVTSEPS